MQDPTWQTKMCIPNKKDPTKCTFSSSIGDPPVPITNEMGINRGLLLASRFGISRNNAKLCGCDCCFVKDSKSVKREDKIAGDVCRKHTIGVVSGSWLVVGWWFCWLVGGFGCCLLRVGTKQLTLLILLIVERWTMNHGVFRCRSRPPPSAVLRFAIYGSAMPAPPRRW